MVAEGWTTVVTVLPPASMVSTSLGPLLTGIMIEQLLLGIVCSQAAIYFRDHFAVDDRFLRSIVTSLVILNIFLGIMDFVIIYWSTVVVFGDFDKFDLQGWATWAEPGVTALVALIAHIFYLRRCWTVTRSLPIIIFLYIVALLAFASGITVSVYCFVLGRLSKLAGAMIPCYVWFLSTSVCDISMATILAFSFWRRGSNVRSTHALLSRLRRTSIETGSLTAICALLNLILCVALIPSGYYMLVQCSMSHMYTLSERVPLLLGFVEPHLYLPLFSVTQYLRTTLRCRKTRIIPMERSDTIKPLEPDPSDRILHRNVYYPKCLELCFNSIDLSSRINLLNRMLSDVTDRTRFEGFGCSHYDI